MSELKKEHREILNLLEEYFSLKGADHLRFGQGLFNLDINQFYVNPQTGQMELNNYLRDIYNDSDTEIIKRMKIMLENNKKG